MRALSWEYFCKLIVKKRRQILRWSVFGLAALAAVLIIFQLAWPYDKFLPWQKIDSFNIGLKNYDEASEQLRQAYLNQAVEFIANNRTIGAATVAEVGIDAVVDDQIDAAKYSLRDRFIPGSVFYKMLAPVDKAPKVSLNTVETASYLERNYATICTVAPINAAIKIEDERLRLAADETGLLCDENRFLSNILIDDLTIEHPLRVKMDGKHIEALVTAASLQDIFDVTRNQLTNGIVFALDAERTLSARYLDMIKWLNIETDVFGHVKISYSDDKIREYLTSSLSSMVRQTSGITVVTELNGVEVSRKLGTTGQDLDYDKMIAAIHDYLERNTERDKKLAVIFVTTDPIIKYKRTFSKNAAGLLALFNNRLNGSSHIVSVTDLSNRGMSRAINDNKVFNSKLAARLLTSYLMIDGVKNNKATQTCFQNVLRDYDENCVRNFFSAIDANVEFGAAGFTATHVNGTSVTTTAVDLTKLLKILASGAAGKDASMVADIKKLAQTDSLSYNADDSDVLLLANIIGGPNSYIIIAVHDGDKAGLKETVAAIEEVFKLE
ncbi:MAG: hypothetical protein LBK50_03400 [Candidatus Nomurabacteria bacterium]|jgi:hypothetical protein|nr:hypothetical protein [Candidatus Nomurabacteria bacterium]